MSWQVIDAVAAALAMPVAGGIFLNQLDELFIDANYLLRGLYRRDRRTLPWKALEKVQQKCIAIMVPAWHESAVIRQMLEHNLASLDHDRSRYTIFCGTYANDPETQGEVDAVARRFPGVRKVVVPHAGPTSKADCLNWVYQGIVLDEQKRGRRYDILLMHDAEDVIHPLSLRLYSLLIPRYQFVQTPVFSLQLGLGQGVAATYIDEFAEHHQKDMLVREAIGGLVPSAGVGSAFDRDAFEEIAHAHGERPFNVESLTEDYEIGLKFRLAGKRVHFACRSVQLKATARTDQGAASGDRDHEEMIATREYFPGGFRASVRQRSRWILGISLQTWRQVGWQGSLPVLYCLWRDRKALFTNALVCLAYLLIGYGAIRLGSVATGVAPAIAPGVVGSRRAIDVLLVLNLVTMTWRAFTKAQLVHRLYGWGHGLLSAPRIVLGNLIGLAATARAVSMFVRHRITGAPLRWLKTAHVFPNVDALRAQRRRLGEWLTEQHLLQPAELDEALAAQQELGRPLGEVLSVLGLTSEHQLARALTEIHELVYDDAAPGEPTDAPLAAVFTALGEAEAERLGVVPIRVDGRSGVRLAAGGPVAPQEIGALEQRLGRPVQIVLAPPAEVRRWRQTGYRRLLAGSQIPSVAVEPGANERECRAAERVRIEDVDWAVLPVLGRGFCVFHAIVPLLPTAPDGSPDQFEGRWLAAAFPLHHEVRATIESRLGTAVTVVPASLLDIDVALSLLSAGSKGEDGDGPGVSTLQMLNFLETEGLEEPLDDEVDAIFQRASLLGLPVSAPDAGPFDWPVLPPELRGRDPIHVRGLAERSLVLATTHPTPRLARKVAALYPGWAIAWQVALPTPENVNEEENPWTRQTFELICN